jgi:GTPase KRas protein
LDNLEEFVVEIRRTKDIADDEPFPCVLVGNKVDLCSNDASSKRQITLKDAQAWSKKFLNDAPVFESSAVTNIHVEDSFFQLVRQCRKAKENIPKKKDEKPRRRSLFSSSGSQEEANDDLSAFKK